MNTTISLTKTATSNAKNNFTYYLMIALLGVSAAFLISIFTSTSAYAGVGIGGGDNGNGGGTTNPGGGGNGGGGQDPPKTVITKGTQPGNAANFSLTCVNWSGSGSWQTSAACNTNKQAVMDANPVRRKTNGNSATASDNGSTPGLSGTPSCGPNGVISAHKQNWWAKYDITAEWSWYVYSDGTRVANGEPYITGYIVQYAFQGCSYPQPQYQYQRCYWNNQGQIDYSTNRLANIGSWTRHYTRTPQAGDPSAPTGGSGNAAPRGKCSGGTGVSNFVSVNSDVTKYGYYSAMYSFNSRLYTHTQYVADGRVWYSPGWQASGTQAHSNRNFFTYSCVPSVGNPIGGPYWSQAGTPNVDAYLNPATCPQVSWQCKVGSPTTIGLDRAAVLAGSLSPNTKASAMRNGEGVPIDFSRIRVIDTATSRDIDVTDGGAAASIKDVTNISYKTTVKPGSTPFYGTDPNSNTQYFKMYTNKSATAQETFGVWRNNVNANLDKAISFNWASDNENKGFGLQRQYKVYASFWTPEGSTVGSGGAGGSQGYDWKVGVQDCRQFDGRGANRVDRGLLTTTSNDITIVRSVNK